MSRKDVLKAFKSKAAQSLAASFQTNPVNVVSIDNVGINIATATVTANSGTFDVQHRMYLDDNNYSAWATLTLSSTPTLANTDATFLVNLNQLPPGQVRVSFTPGGGAPDGTCDIWFSGCAVGG